jgi:hypothetical protein
MNEIEDLEKPIQIVNEKAVEVSKEKRKTYKGIVEDRKWLRNQIKLRIANLKKSKKDLSEHLCDKCGRHQYSTYVEDDLMKAYSEFRQILDSQSKHDSKNDMTKLFDEVIEQSARASIDCFFKYVPDDVKEKVAYEYMNKLRQKTEELIRRATL